jgi:hypothetical protein
MSWIKLSKSQTRHIRNVLVLWSQFVPQSYPYSSPKCLLGPSCTRQLPSPSLASQPRPVLVTFRPSSISSMARSLSYHSQDRADCEAGGGCSGSEGTVSGHCPARYSGLSSPDERAEHHLHRKHQQMCELLDICFAYLTSGECRAGCHL